jgi:hypothetical protein
MQELGAYLKIQQKVIWGINRSQADLQIISIFGALTNSNINQNYLFYNQLYYSLPTA